MPQSIDDRIIAHLKSSGAVAPEHQRSIASVAQALKEEIANVGSSRVTGHNKAADNNKGTGRKITGHNKPAVINPTVAHNKVAVRKTGADKIRKGLINRTGSKGHLKTVVHKINKGPIKIQTLIMKGEKIFN